MGAWVLAAWVVTFASWMLAHGALWLAVARDGSIPRATRWWSVLPPALPWIAWRHGRRVGASLWLTLALLYVALRVVGT